MGDIRYVEEHGDDIYDFLDLHGLNGDDLEFFTCFENEYTSLKDDFMRSWKTYSKNDRFDILVEANAAFSMTVSLLNELDLIGELKPPLPKMPEHLKSEFDFDEKDENSVARKKNAFSTVSQHQGLDMGSADSSSKSLRFKKRLIS